MNLNHLVHRDVVWMKQGNFKILVFFMSRNCFAEFFLARNCCVDVNMMRNCCAEIYMASNCCIGINFYKTFYLIPIPIKLRFFTYLHYPIDTQKSCQKFYEIISHAKLTLHYIHYFQGTHQTNRKEVEILNTMTFNNKNEDINKALNGIYR